MLIRDEKTVPDGELLTREERTVPDGKLPLARVPVGKPSDPPDPLAPVPVG